MAQVLLSEPHHDVRGLFEHMLRRLGHHPIRVRDATVGVITDCDLLLVEPLAQEGAAVAMLARMLRPAIPIVAATIAPEGYDHGVDVDAHLVKPFTLDQLGATIDSLLVSY